MSEHKLLELTEEQYEKALAIPGIPVWATCLEIDMAQHELPNGTPDQVRGRAYEILYLKHAKPVAP